MNIGNILGQSSPDRLEKLGFTGQFIKSYLLSQKKKIPALDYVGEILHGPPSRTLPRLTGPSEQPQRQLAPLSSTARIYLKCGITFFANNSRLV
jgi:hypothetical protein